MCYHRWLLVGTHIVGVTHIVDPMANTFISMARYLCYRVFDAKGKYWGEYGHVQKARLISLCARTEGGIGLQG